MRKVTLGGAMMLLVAAGCSEPISPPTPPDLEPAEQGRATQELVTGGGQFVHPDFGTVTFAFTAVRHRDGSATGFFFQNQHDLGFIYAGKVTCFAVDRVNNRAWIAGDLTYSNDPSDITGVGDDAWFRILDLEKPAADPDRSTFLGFEGGAGIITSEQYCATRLWADGNARTWPVVKGGIAIH